MNNFQWLTALFNTRKKQPLMNRFGRKNNNRGMLWASLIGLGVSAAAFGLRRKQNNQLLQPIQNMIKNFQPNQLQNQQSFAEFSKELMPNNNNNQQ